MSRYLRTSRTRSPHLVGVVPPRPEGTERWHVVAGMATHAPRIPTAAMAILSVARQVDELHVYLNGHDECQIPDCLPRAQNVMYHPGPDLGTLGRLGFQAGADLYLTVDDDVVYPADYTYRHIEAQLRYPQTVTCFHGSILHQPYVSYLASRTVLVGYRIVPEDTRVHVGAMYSTAWRPYDITIPLDAAGRTLQVDVPTSIYVRSHGFRIICLAHEGCYLDSIRGADQSVSICRMTANDASPIDADVLRHGLHLETP